MERCEILLCYAGNGIFVQLVPHEIPPTPIPSDEPIVKHEVLGTLTVDETSTLSILVKEGLNTSKEDKKPIPCTSASAGSADDLPHIESELS